MGDNPNITMALKEVKPKDVGLFKYNQHFLHIYHTVKYNTHHAKYHTNLGERVPLSHTLILGAGSHVPLLLYSQPCQVD